MNFATSFNLLLLGVFVLPVLVSSFPSNGRRRGAVVRGAARSYRPRTRPGNHAGGNHSSLCRPRDLLAGGAVAITSDENLTLNTQAEDDCRPIAEGGAVL